MNQKPELVYDNLQPATEFEPFEMTIDADTMDRFLTAIGEDRGSMYGSQAAAEAWGYDRPLAPHSLAAVYARLSYLKNYTMPGGGILARQEFQFFRPVFIGDRLVCRARVVDRYLKKDRRYVVIEINTTNQEGQQVSVVRIVAIWPK